MHSGRTEHYGFPQFMPKDKPSWITDINAAMRAVDATLWNFAHGGLPNLVNSVNGKTGTVELDANDVGAVAQSSVGVSGGVAEYNETNDGISAAYNLAASKPDVANTVPLSDVAGGSAGVSPSAARSDHRHPIDGSRAPTNHASENTTYGAGSAVKYGHVKLSSSHTSASDVDGGVAATPKAVKDAYDHASSKPNLTNAVPKMDSAVGSAGSASTAARADHVHPSDNSKAPVAHASTGTEYGVGNSGNYGHVKLSDSASSTSGESDGVAATPAAVKTVADAIANKPDVGSVTPSMDSGSGSAGTATSAARADHVHPSDNSRAPTSHASSAATYGLGSGSNYGHLRLSSSLSSASGESGGVAATPSAVKAANDNAISAKNLADEATHYNNQKIHRDTIPVTLPASGGSTTQFTTEQVSTILGVTLIIDNSGSNIDTINGTGTITSIGKPISVQGLKSREAGVSGTGFVYIGVPETLTGTRTAYAIVEYTLASGE